MTPSDPPAPAPLPRAVLLLFLDGVGLGPDDPDTNPLARAPLPALRSLLGGAAPVLRDGAPPPGGSGARLVAADPNLGLAGRPQSGTGQTALLTGVNAAARFGRHFGPWVPTGLRPMLARENLLSRAAAAGRRVAFANAYPAGYLSHPRGARRPSAPPLAADAAGALCRHAPELRQGRAVASSITNEAWRSHLDPDAPAITAAEAGQNLAGICAEAELTLFAHYDTDLVGHRGDMDQAVVVLKRVDQLVEGLLANLADDTLLVIASDHGNLEDVTTGHTRNPVPVVARGPGADRVAERVRCITDVAPTLLQLLGVD